MASVITEKLLQDQRVIEEINRHLWIESEKAGQDIGFENAKSDWLKKYAKAWISENMPESAKAPVVKPKAAVQKRRAKSYI